VRKFGRVSKRAAGTPEVSLFRRRSAADRLRCAPEKSARPVFATKSDSLHCRLSEIRECRVTAALRSASVFQEVWWRVRSSEAGITAGKSQGHTQSAAPDTSSAECGWPLLRTIRYINDAGPRQLTTTKLYTHVLHPQAGSNPRTDSPCRPRPEEPDRRILKATATTATQPRKIPKALHARAIALSNFFLSSF